MKIANDNVQNILEREMTTPAGETSLTLFQICRSGARGEYVKASGNAKASRGWQEKIKKLKGASRRRELLQHQTWGGGEADTETAAGFGG